MRTFVKVLIVIATLLAVAIAGYSLLIIGIDLFGERTAMSGMGLAIGAVGLVVASVIGLGVVGGIRYLTK